MYDFDLATDYELGMEAYEAEQEELEKKQKEGVTLLTDKGLVKGHFIGAVEYPVAGDPVNGWETEFVLAFRKKNGHIVAAEKNGQVWSFKPLCALSCILHWGLYPEELEEEKRSDAFFHPTEKPIKRLSAFVDHPSRTDCGSCLYIVRIVNKKYEYETEYAGHNRNLAAKKIKEIKAAGKYPTVEVYDITRQDEYDTLPF